MSIEVIGRVPVGRRVIVFEQYDDGLLEIRREEFRPYDSAPQSLQDIWRDDAPFSFDLFIKEIVRVSMAYEDIENNRLVWPGQGVTVRACIEVLTEHQVIKEQSTESVFKAFAGTFHLPRIKDARSIRKRSDEKSQSAHEYRKKLKRFREDITNLFFS